MLSFPPLTLAHPFVEHALLGTSSHNSSALSPVMHSLMHFKLHGTHIVSPASVLIQLHEPVVVYHKTCVHYLNAGFGALYISVYGWGALGIYYTL